MNDITIRLAKQADLPALEMIEQSCFAAERRDNRRSLQRTLRSPKQQVWLATTKQDGRQVIAGAMSLRLHPHTLRLYSIAVLPAFRGSGLGHKLLDHALQEARRKQKRQVSLEMERDDKNLLRWYAQFGFQPTRILKDYYAPGCDGLRMQCPILCP